MAAQNQSIWDLVDVKNKDINEAAGVSLNARQKLAVGSVLDLFEGHPSLKHLALWNPKGTFQDPIALAEGYDRFAAQWYGLPALFDHIAIQSHKVTDGGNPIFLELSNKYVLKGIKKEQLIHSVVRINLALDGRIDAVEDRWNDKLPNNSVSEVLRKLSASITSNLIKVPSTEEEDNLMKAERRQQE
ncbi:hypothetical protein NOR_08615 [Metarhizium rileyi]|uniref:SnoaL-like domain-containing protein n=1 Tax=Metarhizium rileyi (strain RCEF 4871) TaxID=1649241 RepID=A0A166W044_METRR|nr:hypothetical protein NOR_08615 [Metarhizium rileyi RCEF 4871]